MNCLNYLHFEIRFVNFLSLQLLTNFTILDLNHHNLYKVCILTTFIEVINTDIVKIKTYYTIIHIITMIS